MEEPMLKMWGKRGVFRESTEAVRIYRSRKEEEKRENKSVRVKKREKKKKDNASPVGGFVRVGYFRVVSPQCDSNSPADHFALNSFVSSAAHNPVRPASSPTPCSPLVLCPCQIYQFLLPFFPIMFFFKKYFFPISPCQK